MCLDFDLLLFIYLFFVIVFVCVLSGNASARIVKGLFANNWYQSPGCLIVVLTNFMARMMRFDIEKFDGKINFGLWQVQVKDILIQNGLHKALKGKSTPANPEGSGDSSKETASTSSGKQKMSDDDWEDLDERAASAIRLCLAKNVLANIHGTYSAKELWERLEELYQANSVCNRFYLKEQFHMLHMTEGTKISDHLGVLNGIVSELESIGVKIDEEDKGLRLIWSLPPSYAHMKPILMHGSSTICFGDVANKLISEERRLKSEGKSFDNLALLVDRKKGNSKGKVTCWGCGQSGHIRKDCKNKKTSVAKGSKEGDPAIASLEYDDYSDAL